MDGEARVLRRLQQGEAAEGHGRARVAGQINPRLQKARMVGPHVAVEEQEGLAARGLGQAVAAFRTALIGVERDQAHGQGHAVDQGAQTRGQRGVLGAVVEHDQFGLSGQTGRLGVQTLQQVGRIVAQEGDQHRQDRLGLGPCGTVMVKGVTHVICLRARRKAFSRTLRSRTPAAFRA